MAGKDGLDKIREELITDIGTDLSQGGLGAAMNNVSALYDMNKDELTDLAKARGMAVSRKDYDYDDEDIDVIGFDMEGNRMIRDRDGDIVIVDDDGDFLGYADSEDIDEEYDDDSYEDDEDEYEFDDRDDDDEDDW